MEDKPNKKRITHTLTGMMMALASATAACTPATDFDREAWRAEGEKSLEQTKRWAMAAAVLRQITPGMTRDQVIAELGQPDSSKPHGSGSTDVYYLGLPDQSMHLVQFDLEYTQQKLASIRYTR
ncbi:outer membrane protein assembly factor BamE domain-containing protein [Glutamicibacter soli]